eukprot:scaffold127523_cov27-Tisochrysis_lutea.AAC.4
MQTIVHFAEGLQRNSAIGVAFGLREYVIDVLGVKLVHLRAHGEQQVAVLLLRQPSVAVGVMRVEPRGAVALAAGLSGDDAEKESTGHERQHVWPRAAPAEVWPRPLRRGLLRHVRQRGEERGEVGRKQGGRRESGKRAAGETRRILSYTAGEEKGRRGGDKR